MKTSLKVKLYNHSVKFMSIKRYRVGQQLKGYSTFILSKNKSILFYNICLFQQKLFDLIIVIYELFIIFQNLSLVYLSNFAWCWNIQYQYNLTYIHNPTTPSGILKNFRQIFKNMFFFIQKTRTYVKIP